MIKKYKLIVMTNATEGDDDAFNDWYDNIHLPDVLKIPGFVAAQRFRLAAPLAGEPVYRYCAIYEVETSDPQAALQRLVAAGGTADMEISNTLHPKVLAALYEESGASNMTN